LFRIGDKKNFSVKREKGVFLAQVPDVLFAIKRAVFELAMIKMHESVVFLELSYFLNNAK